MLAEEGNLQKHTTAAVEPGLDACVLKMSVAMNCLGIIQNDKSINQIKKVFVSKKFNGNAVSSLSMNYSYICMQNCHATVDIRAFSSASNNIS